MSKLPKINPEALDRKIKQFLLVSGLLTNPTAITSQKDAYVEEFGEMQNAYKDKDVVEFIDGLADTMFVALSLRHIDQEVSKKYVTSLVTWLENLPVNQELNSKERNFENLVYYITVIVADSNLSKFDVDEFNAFRTLMHYRDIGIEVEIHHNEASNLYYVTSVQEQQDVLGKEYYEGKILKSVSRFQSPIFPNDIIEKFSKIFFV